MKRKIVVKFITGLLLNQYRFNMIDISMVIIDRYIKTVRFFIYNETIIIVKLRELFIKEVLCT